MRATSPDSNARRRSAVHRAVALLTAALLGAAVLVVSPWVAQTAQAITQVQNASGYPGEQVTVVIRNDSTGPVFTNWTVQAPPGTSIVSAGGSAASGSSPFPCNGSGTVVQCGPSGAGGWAAGNIVTVNLQIDAGATAGFTSGTSSIEGSESGTYGVTVLAPPAPEITAPANGLRTLDPQPAISGTKRAGNSATAFVDGVFVCNVPADAATTWTCLPAAPLAPGVHAITATQTSPAEDVSSASAPISVEILTPAALSVAQSGAETVVPTVQIERSITVTNTGPGVAEAVTATVDLGGFPATTCTVAGTATDCTLLGSGANLGDLASGAAAQISILGTAPAGTAAGTVYTITASSSTINDAASPVTAAGSVAVAAPPPPQITSPAAGSTTTDRAPSIAGTALAGAVVTVRDAAGEICTVTASSSGSWSCTPSRSFALGGVGLTATQTVGGLASGSSTTVQFTVVAPPVPPPPSTGTPTPPRQVRPPAPAPVPTPTPIPAPPTAAPQPSPSSQPTVRPLGMSLRFPGVEIAAGTVSAMRGTIGPNTTEESVTLTFTGTVNKGMIYRSVIVDPDGECEVLTTTFNCTVTLAPGESANVEIRLYADPLNAPATARQQLTLGSSEPDQANSATSTINIANRAGEEAAEASFLTLDMTSFPGAFLPLLALLLFALAATETERRRRSGSPTPPTKTDS